MNLTKSMIVDGLYRLGIRPGDSYVIHSSLKNFGWVEGGPDAVIDAMIESVDPGGTVFVPTMTFGVPFNPERTPSRTGIITEVFRRRPEAVRSLSPSHSLAGIGPDAARILAGHENTIPNGPESPLGKLARENGSILLAGVTHVSNTTIHLVTYFAELPYLDVWREIEVSDNDGHTKIVRALNPGCSDGFDNLEPFLIAKNAITFGKIGNATVRYMKGADVLDIGVEAVNKNPGLLLCDKPDCAWCTRAHKILKES